jgi:hypothetical protein
VSCVLLGVKSAGEVELNVATIEQAAVRPRTRVRAMTPLDCVHITDAFDSHNACESKA